MQPCFVKFLVLCLIAAHGLHSIGATVVATNDATTKIQQQITKHDDIQYLDSYDIDDVGDGLLHAANVNLLVSGDTTTSASNENETHDTDFDVLIFTQQWPVTTCYHWREQDKTHKCKLPKGKEFWTIHGIWPSKLGNVGPNFCNKSATFDVELLEKILDQMKVYWPDLDESDQNNWLWKHEWLKHGTCAAQVEKLDNELKYFSQGLEWMDKYLAAKILDAFNIQPDSAHTVITYNTAFTQALGHNPSIHCLYDHEKDISYLAEIRLCFNKTLELIDCDGVKWGDTVSIKYPAGTVNTNCHVAKAVQYPSLVPPVQRKQRGQKWKFPVVNMYKLLQFIMWFTL